MLCWSKAADRDFQPVAMKLKKNTNAQELRKKTREMEVGFQPGELFSSSRNFKNYIRLGFAYYSEEDIREGIARLKPLFD